MVEPASPAHLPRHDYWVLPLLSLVTVVILFGLAEAGARFFWPDHERDVCEVGNAIQGFRHRPNCDTRIKAAEGIWTTNHYNECGYRSDTSCGPKPPDSLRIVLLGSSVSEGLYIPWEQTFFVLAAKQIQARCGKYVDVQSLGSGNSGPIIVYQRLGEALAMKPDVIVFVVTPFDLESQIDPQRLVERNNPNAHFSTAAVQYRPGLFKILHLLVLESRAVLVAQHYMFSDGDTFAKMYLMYGERADFLRTPLTPGWEKRFDDLDLIIKDMADRTRAAGASLIVMPVPSRAEAALLSTHHPPPHTDGAAFGKRLEAIAAKDGAGAIDSMTVFKAIPHSETLYYPVNGHLTPEGEQVLARSLTNKLLDGGIPALSKCPDPRRKS